MGGDARCRGEPGARSASVSTNTSRKGSGSRAGPRTRRKRSPPGPSTRSGLVRARREARARPPYETSHRGGGEAFDRTRARAAGPIVNCTRRRRIEGSTDDPRCPRPSSSARSAAADGGAAGRRRAAAPRVVPSYGGDLEMTPTIERIRDVRREPEPEPQPPQPPGPAPPVPPQPDPQPQPVPPPQPDPSPPPPTAGG